MSSVEGVLFFFETVTLRDITDNNVIVLCVFEQILTQNWNHWGENF